MRTYLSGTAITLVLLLAANAASAVSLNPRGIGQALIYPYYTVNKGQDTLISVVNASDVSKAVHVRFREGYDARSVSEIHLFLSPHDVWTASVSQAADDGGAILHSSDATCTIPAIPQAGLAFYSGMYDGRFLPPDGGPTGITRTREGYFEILSSGDLVPGSATDVAIRHVQNGSPNGGVPSACPSPGSPIDADEVAPTDGLYGSAAIVNVTEGTFYPFNAEALQGFTDVVLPFGADGSGDSVLGVSLGYANSSEASPPYFATAYVIGPNGRPLALEYVFGEDAVSAVFMADAIHNEYLVSAGLGANTDWVITFPTKQFYVTPGNTAIPPFAEAFHAPGLSNVAVGDAIYDREEWAGSRANPPEGCGFICPGVEPLKLPYQTNVLSFLPGDVPANAPSGVFGSNLTTRYLMINGQPTVGPSGWLTLGLDSQFELHVLPGGFDADGHEIDLIGLPVTGFMAYNVINAQAQPGRLANYGGTFRHRTTFLCDGADAVCAPIITDRAAAATKPSVATPTEGATRR